MNNNCFNLVLKRTDKNTTVLFSSFFNIKLVIKSSLGSLNFWDVKLLVASSFRALSVKVFSNEKYLFLMASLEKWTKLLVRLLIFWEALVFGMVQFDKLPFFILEVNFHVVKDNKTLIYRFKSNHIRLKKNQNTLYPFLNIYTIDSQNIKSQIHKKKIEINNCRNPLNRHFDLFEVLTKDGLSAVTRYIRIYDFLNNNKYLKSFEDKSLSLSDFIKIQNSDAHKIVFYNDTNALFIVILKKIYGKPNVEFLTLDIRHNMRVDTALLYIRRWGEPRTRLFEAKLMENLVLNFLTLDINTNNFMNFELQNNLQIFMILTNFCQNLNFKC
ncbi:hypothetical protein AGLY_004374 [Aphis glycines]|uniref:Uncharacterized protein n=1 Tax=Aphis glycines TaxID=307491 RepID=A0A6G0TXV7_APHGL|nr:hypothetical protein AGLY_004374 [Aphis glycines]